MAASQKVALVTGAGTGIGKAVALALMQEGYAVVLAGRRADKLEETAQRGEVRPAPRASSCRPTSAIPPRSRRCSPRPRRPSAASTCCSTMPASARRAVPLEDLPYETWKKVVDTNLTGMFLCTQEAIKIMKAQDPRGGRIINNGSISAHAPRPRVGRLHRDQACGDRAHQVDRARLPRLRHHAAARSTSATPRPR